MIGASVDWYRHGFQGAPGGDILRGISESKLRNIAMICQRADKQLQVFAARLGTAA